MTATAPPTELKYIFARIEDEKLVEDPDNLKFEYGGPGDSWESFITPVRKDYPGVHRNWVLLVPESPVLYAPSNTFWDRVAQHPSVEYFSGYWHNWEAGPLPVPLPPRDPPSISVFLVPSSQYRQLNEERDKLTELRTEVYSKRPEQIPSKGSSVSAFIKAQKSDPIAIGRPKREDFYHIPVSLFHPAFAQFKDDLVSGPLDKSLSSLACRWMTELSAFFDNEGKREAKFHELLSELLDDYTISKKTFGSRSYETDGGISPGPKNHFPDLLVKPLLVEVKVELTQKGNSDAFFEIVLYDQEGVRTILADDRYKGDWRKTRLPSLLLIHNGPNIQALGAVHLMEQYVEVLSPSLPLYFSEYDIHAFENLIRFMTALRRLFRSLCNVYDNPNDYAVDSTQVSFPCYCFYDSFSGSKVRFTYTKRISQVRLVFSARTEDNKDIIVKFGDGRYGTDAHKAAAEAGLVPALLGYSKLDGGMWMVAMESMEDDFVPCNEFQGLVQSCKDAIRMSVRKLHGLGFVHGDLRDGNVFVREQGEDRWDCQIIDYDWAGREGEVVYPLGVYNTDFVWRPERYLDGEKITVKHDCATLEEFLERHTTVNRF
jgi:hypothetical protein